jgi:hypothetical protein
MSDIIGIAWYKDEHTYRSALTVFTDSENMPATYEDWKALVGRQCEEIKRVGNIAIRADIDPETFIDWCNRHGCRADSQGRTAFVNNVELDTGALGFATARDSNAGLRSITVEVLRHRRENGRPAGKNRP